jgi:uncharacterized protein (TIGR02453 family)
MAFQGFGPQALPFFKALAFHQTREWFEQNRETYERDIKGPMGDLIEDVAAHLAKARIPIKGDRKSSLFRLHRDVRFSPNKDPYKTHAGAALTKSGSKNDPGLLYFHLSPEECFFAAGFYRPDPQELARLRAAAAHAPTAFRRMTGKLGRAGLALSDEDALKRSPRGFEDVENLEVAAAIRLKHFICLRPVPEARLRERALVDDFITFAAESLPLLEWGWAAIIDSR